MLARFSGWGGLSALFDTRTDTYERERETLQSLVDEAAYKRALQSTANAHYTQPTIARLLWQSLQSLGLAEGARVVEPGCGVGTFIGTAPENTRMVGVEIDPTPATIAAKLYPNADIRAQSYTDTDLDEHGYFDAAIGNVPFGSFRPYDPVYNPGGHTIHNYFISKALAQVRPGGIVAVLTSRYTMDAKNPGVRRELYARADLVGAIRLPSGTHQEMAGTDVVSDILIFRRREKGDEPRPFDWEYAPLLEVGEGEYPVNEYFQAHPDHVLGEWEETTNQYGAALSVKGDTAALGTKLSTALETITSQARAAGLVFTPRQERYEGEIALRPVDQEKLGRITKTEEGFERYTATGNVPVKVAKNASAQLTALLKLRDQTRALVEFESQTQENPPALNHARSSLKASYEAYVAKFGPLNSQRERWYTDKKTGEEKLSWIDVPAVRVFRTDPDAALTMAIEIFDKDTRMARPAGILERRQIGITFKPLGADSVEDALAICMAEKGRVDTEYISYLTGQPSEEVIAGLHDHTFMDPETGELVERSAYLSGNIHAKVVAAEDALETDARMSENIAALKSVMPEPLSLSDIEISPGAPWISVKDHHDFYSEVVMGWHQQRVGQVGYNPVTGAWKAVQDGYQPSAKARRIWNTERRSGTQIFEALLNHTPITVKSKTIDGEEFIDRAETAAVAQKMEAMATAFTEWVWAAGERASRLEARYNEMFNSFVPRDYTGMGEKLTLPGLAKDIVPYSHQRSGVARMIYQEAVGLFHQVGAGKTKTMIMGAMELKRLGLIHKPVIAVPANVLFQFASEFQQTYPAARVLTATPDDLTKSGRREFVAKVATPIGEEQSAAAIRPSIPTLYDGVERTALTEAAPGVFIAKYGESVVTFLDEEHNQRVGVPYQRLFPEPGEPALYAYPDLDIEHTGNIAGSGQVARALLLDSRQDAAYLDEVAPGWSADVDAQTEPVARDLETADADDVTSEESMNVRYVPPIYKGETPERVEVLAPGIETATYESAGTIVFLDPEVDALLPNRYRHSLFAYPGSETSAAYREDQPREAHLRGAAQVVRALLLGNREDARYCHAVDPTWNDDASEVRAQYKAYCAANYKRQAAAPIFTAVSRAVNAARTIGAREAADPREHGDALM